jgi:hypothetical protein
LRETVFFYSGSLIVLWCTTNRTHPLLPANYKHMMWKTTSTIPSVTKLQASWFQQNHTILKHE